MQFSDIIALMALAITITFSLIPFFCGFYINQRKKELNEFYLKEILNFIIPRLKKSCDLNQEFINPNIRNKHSLIIKELFLEFDENNLNLLEDHVAYKIYKDKFSMFNKIKQQIKHIRLHLPYMQTESYFETIFKHLESKGLEYSDLNHVQNCEECKKQKYRFDLSFNFLREEINNLEKDIKTFL